MRPAIKTCILIILFVLITAGSFFLIVTFKIFKDYNHLYNAKQVDIEADLSKPGEFSCDFIQTRKPHLGHAIYLNIPSDELSPSVLLESLEFECKITDPNGNIVIDSNTEGRLVRYHKSYGRLVPLLFLRKSLDPGYYRFTFTVNKGDPKLNGLEQRIVCKHLLCGCLMLPAMYTFCFAIVSFLSAGIIILILFIKKRKNIRKIPTT